MEQLERQVIEQGIRELLSKKHLYQQIKLDFKPAIALEAETRHEALTTPVPLPVGTGGIRHTSGRKLLSLTEITEQLVKEANYRHWYFGEDNSVIRSKVQFSFPPMRTLCSRCDDVEAFNLFGEQPVHVISVGGNGHQVFSFTVECQSCKLCIIVFLVKRTGPKIQLVGRSDIEKVQTPEYIPKELDKYYSGAEIAFDAGHPLPALFMLRTLIEQHMRAETGRTDLRGDFLCEEYAKLLDDAFKGSFPSFKDIYDKLSDALHRADDSTVLYEAERERIKSHFHGKSAFAEATKLKG